MPWVVRDAVDEINRAVGRRWQGLDRLLPPRAELPEGCAAPFVAAGANGRPAGLAACRHERVKAGTLNQTWGTADRFSLIARLREADTSAALDDLVGQWRDHLAGLPGTRAGDTAAMITWPARDVSGVTTLLRHGLQPITVIAVRPARSTAAGPRPAGDETLVIREAAPADLEYPVVAGHEEEQPDLGCLDDVVPGVGALVPRTVGNGEGRAVDHVRSRFDLFAVEPR